MIDKESVEVFLSILSAMENNTIKEIFNCNSLRELLQNIDIENAMETFYNYVGSYHVGDKVLINSTNKTGAIFSLSEDGKRANIVVDSFDDISEQVVTIGVDDLKRI